MVRGLAGVEVMEVVEEEAAGSMGKAVSGQTKWIFNEDIQKQRTYRGDPSFKSQCFCRGSLYLFVCHLYYMSKFY